MIELLKDEWKLWRIWMGCLLMTLAALFFGEDGLWLLCFFLGCTIFVVASFHRSHATGASQIFLASGNVRSAKVWHRRVLASGFPLLLQWIVLSSICLLQDRTNLVDPALAFGTVIVSLCIAPYLTVATGRPFVAVVLTLFAMACMKFVSGAVTVLVYGWHATEFGHTTLTWTHPNLIVCTLLISTTTLSITLYRLGKRAFCSGYVETAG